MRSCPSCGVPRVFVGVAFPVRRLCKCEARTCARCKTPAVFVEFQGSIKQEEPALPAKSGGVAQFSCKEHAPDDLPEEPVAVEVPAGEVKARPRKTGGRPHIDPIWEKATAKPPPGAESSDKVQCLSCERVHALRDRLMWNGTYSECPVETCKSTMF